MAEYVLGQIIAHERQFIRLAAQQQQRQWNQMKHEPYRPLGTLTLGLLGGLGDLGQAIARVASAFGMRIHALGHAPRTRPEGLVADRITYLADPDGLAAVLANADYVVATLPSTPSTRGLLTCATPRAPPAGR